MHLIATFLLASLASASPLAKRATGYSSGDNARDVEDGVCAPLTVIFARGTSESGNIGTIVGPPLFQSLSSKLNGNVALQGVNYAADVAGAFNGGASGGPAMASLVKQALQQCPSTKVAISGYSQGGLVIHHALNNDGLSSNSISAIAYFGDPGYQISASGTVPDSKIKQYCASGDDVCENHTFSITSAHLSYGSNADDAASFIISTADASSVTPTAPSSPSTTSSKNPAAASSSTPSSTSSSKPFYCAFLRTLPTCQ